MRLRTLIALSGIAFALSATPLAATSVAYTYDTLGRLIQVTYTNGSTVTNVYYCYDDAGNRTQVQTSTPTC